MKRVLAVCVLLVGCSRGTSSSTDERTGVTNITSAPADLAQGDQQLVRRAEAALAADPTLSVASGDVEVDAVDGAVTVRGSVARSATERAVIDAVERATGRPVVDQLAVPSSGRVDMNASDDTIAFKLERAMSSDPVAAAEMDGISIDVVKGLVTLRGHASSASTRNAVEQLVERTPGVVAVRDDVEVGR